ncbi:glycosyltransferase family 2 protein [Sediminibacterium sp.]|uniref:glycosyltransferase family 2 protein n=1 Tax=Sediminibacterium sp. TaxID=1917865 RepID=UPI0025EEFC9C|nr:glycosyltransferase family 2 protein [Sediminibacterium sp.]MBT9483524.1 glycosyltransferase family 2 protein [Sediminibacterium sp.]
MEIFFWISIAVILYTYLGYGLLLFMLLKIKGLLVGKKVIPDTGYTPSVTVVVAAYNEAYCIEEKIVNTLALNYPPNKIRFIFITDGSTDETPSIIAKYPQILGMHEPGRSGKIAAVHRAMSKVDTQIVVFTDANTMLNKDAILLMCRHYQDEKVGAIAGEKRVQIDDSADATAGEGFYWKYESKLKKWDSELYSVVGAAGELFSIRTNLYEPVAPDTILDDFMISMNIALKGYKIVYEPDAYATELASANTGEELKRKIRIAAGGVQSTIRLRALLLPFKQPVLSFEYISHRILRWVVTPYLMILAFIINIVLVINLGFSNIYGLMLLGQLVFYIAALLGWVMEQKQLKVKIFFIPYYFCLMNYAVIAGFVRYFFGEQSVLWEKAKRK